MPLMHIGSYNTCTNTLTLTLPRSLPPPGLGICVGLGTLLWFSPPPAGVSIKAWHLLSVFTGTIVGIITTPLPLGAVAVLGLGVAMLTKVLTFAEAFSAFSSEIP